MATILLNGRELGGKPLAPQQYLVMSMAIGNKPASLNCTVLLHLGFGLLAVLMREG